MKKINILIIFSLFLFSTFAWGALPVAPTIPSYPSVAGTGSTYYVDKDNGDDGRTKEQAQVEGTPWDTITHGISQMSAGDTLIVLEAATAYDEDFGMNLVGTSDQWFQIKGKTGDRPEINNNDDGHLITISGNAAYVYFANFDIVHGYATGDAIKIYNGCTHIVLDDLDVDGSTYGVVVGSEPQTGEASDIYLRSIVAHGTSNSAIQLFANCHDIVLDQCTAYGSTGNDGIGTHLAYGAGETWQNIGPPDDDADTLSDIYLVDCLVYNNDSDGIDLGSVRGETVIKNTKVYNNGDTGVKVWGLEVWLINNLIYENDTGGTGGAGIYIKPLWANSPYYLIGNTVVNNSGSVRSEFRIGYINGAFTCKAPLIYLYNNLFQASGELIVMVDGPNCPVATCWSEGDGNLYFKPSDNTYGMIEYDGSWNIVNDYNIDEMSDGTWNTASGIDANCVSSIAGADPGFTNLAGDDYTLTTGSIAIDAGVVLNQTYDDGLNPASVWTSAVLTSDQDDHGTGWEIGAYVYTAGGEYPPAPVITDTTTTPLTCPYGQDPLNVTFSFTTDVNAYGRISTTNQTWDQMTSAKAMDNGDGTTNHSHVVSLACDQTISYYGASSTEPGDNGAESATTEIEVVIGAEQGINPPVEVSNLGSGSIGISNLGSGGISVVPH